MKYMVLKCVHVSLCALLFLFMSSQFSTKHLRIETYKREKSEP